MNEPCLLAADANTLNPPDPEYAANALPLETEAGGGLVGIVENADIGVVPSKNFLNTDDPSWDGAPKAGVGVADVMETRYLHWHRKR